MPQEELRFEEFSSLISGVHGDIGKLKARYTTQLGLKGVHVFWLYLLHAHPEGLSASELAAAGGSDRSLVSRELDALFAEGIVFTPDGPNTKSGGGKRRYGWKLQLTEKGRALAELIAAVVTDIQNTVSRDIPPQDLAVFYRTLRVLAARFRELEKSNDIQEVIDQWLCNS